MNWYLDVLKKYAVFTGRARRKEYWMFVLINAVISLVLRVIDGMIGSVGILGALYGLAVCIPSIAVSVRRLHDTNRSGWWLLLGFIPVIGWIVLLFFAATEGQKHENRYGPDPKAGQE